MGWLKCAWRPHCFVLSTVHYTVWVRFKREELKVFSCEQMWRLAGLRTTIRSEHQLLPPLVELVGWRGNS